MTRSLFDRCIEVVLKSEGGYQCDPADIGNYTPDGELVGTNFGISARLFPDEDIKNLDRERAEDLYYYHYWLPMNLEGINNDDLVLHIFDHGVNAGKGTAIRMIQRLVNVKADGKCGPVTKKAINDFGQKTEVIHGYGLLVSLLDHYKYARHKYYTDLTVRRPVTKKYIRGWYMRIDKTHF